jgi:hypothetical protein
LPDIHAAAGLLASVYDPLKFVTDFARSIKDFVGLFQKDQAEQGPKDLNKISIKTAMTRLILQRQ